MKENIDKILYKLFILGSALMITFGALETFGIVSIFPLVSVLSDPEIIQNNKYLNLTYEYFNFASIQSFLIFLTSLVFFITVTRTLFNGFLNHSILRSPSP